LEWELQQMGFDYTYDKRLYDRLLHSSADDVRGHLLADAEYQKKLLRFIENHDEPRILSQVPLEQAQAAGVILATIQGAKLIFDGQIEGKKIRIPVHMGREPKEKSLVQNIAFYKKLMNFSNDHFLKEGSWRILEVRSAWEGNDSFHNILAWKWSLEEKLKVIIVNYSDVESQARIFWPDVQPQGANLTFLDRYEKNTYERKADEIHKQGLYVSLLPWKFHWFMAEENKKANLQKEKALI
ncbi:MAG: hypothetical protein KC618_09090, partial [Candidatus Omnitrophica bacterium]|nr:hypothetical protein [Candidatus Omnitrophota bacterium]